MKQQTAGMVKPLDRYLTPVDVWAIAFGCMVGWGVFAMAAYKLAKAEGNGKAKATGWIGTVISVIFLFVQLVPGVAALDAMESEAFLLLAF